MFSKNYKAKLRNANLKAADKDGVNAVTCDLGLHYEFTAELAEGLGGVAVNLQKALASSTPGESLDSGVITMKAADMTMVIKTEGGEALEIKEITGCKPNGKSPLAEDPNPTLAVTVSFVARSEEEDDGRINFLIDNLGAVVDVRMDRKQLGLPGTGDPGAE